jgi:hypothetical protein
MSAEIILPACHHFNAEPALQAPKTSSAFQPCATVMRLTSPQPGESPVPLQKTQSAFHARSQTKLVTRLPSRLLPNTFGVASAKAGHLRRFFLPPSYFILSSGADRQGGQRALPETLFVLLEIKRSAGMMTGFCY